MVIVSALSRLFLAAPHRIAGPEVFTQLKKAVIGLVCCAICMLSPILVLQVSERPPVHYTSVAPVSPHKH
jgi:hypothetical protein